MYGRGFRQGSFEQVVVTVELDFSFRAELSFEFSPVSLEWILLIVPVPTAGVFWTPLRQMFSPFGCYHLGYLRAANAWFPSGILKPFFFSQEFHCEHLRR